MVYIVPNYSVQVDWVCVCVCVCVWIITRGIWVLARILCIISDPVVHVCMLNCFSCVQLCAILWTVAHQAPLSMDSSGKNTGVGCYALLHGIFLTQGPNSRLLLSPALAGRFFTTSATWEADCTIPVAKCFENHPGWMNERINELLDLISSFILISLLFGDIFTLTFKSLWINVFFLSLFSH